jgi:hypothetical protein
MPNINIMCYNRANSSDTSLRVKDMQKDLSLVVAATAGNLAEIVELKAIK